MSTISYVKCPECGIRNVNSDYCINCGAIINIILKRRIENEAKIQKKIEQQKIKQPGKIDNFFKKYESHPNVVLRGIFKALSAVWIVSAMAIGGLIASVIAAAAG